MSQETATAAVARRDVEDQLERVQRRSPVPEPVAQCPYCHRKLERREVIQERELHAVFATGSSPSIVLLTFWGCTNEKCRLMFWQHPDSSEPSALPRDEDGPEH